MSPARLGSAGTSNGVGAGRSAGRGAGRGVWPRSAPLQCAVNREIPPTRIHLGIYVASLKERGNLAVKSSFVCFFVFVVFPFLGNYFTLLHRLMNKRLISGALAFALGRAREVSEGKGAYELFASFPTSGSLVLVRFNYVGTFPPSSLYLGIPLLWFVLVCPGRSGPVLRFTNMNAKWNQKSSEDTLKNINLTVNRGELLAVIGPVGAGKVRPAMLDPSPLHALPSWRYPRTWSRSLGKCVVGCSARGLYELSACETVGRQPAAQPSVAGGPSCGAAGCLPAGSQAPSAG